MNYIDWVVLSNFLMSSVWLEELPGNQKTPTHQNSSKISVFLLDDTNFAILQNGGQIQYYGGGSSINNAYAIVNQYQATQKTNYHIVVVNLNKLFP